MKEQCSHSGREIPWYFIHAPSTPINSHRWKIITKSPTENCCNQAPTGGIEALAGWCTTSISHLHVSQKPAIPEVSCQPASSLTPYQCILGYQPPLFPLSGEPSEVPAINHWFRESERIWDDAHHHLQRAIRRQKIQADARQKETPQYRPGQMVRLSTKDFWLKLPSCKLSLRFIGHFSITRPIIPVFHYLNPTTHPILIFPQSITSLA